MYHTLQIHKYNIRVGRPTLT